MPRHLLSRQIDFASRIVLQRRKRKVVGSQRGAKPKLDLKRLGFLQTQVDRAVLLNREAGPATGAVQRNSRPRKALSALATGQHVPRDCRDAHHSISTPWYR